MPAPIPIGTEIREAMPTIVNDPTIAFAIPPPFTFGGAGNLVKKPMLIAGAPLIITSPSMSRRGITARATVTITNIVINLLMIFRRSEMLVGRFDVFILNSP